MTDPILTTSEATNEISLEHEYFIGFLYYLANDGFEAAELAYVVEKPGKFQEEFDNYLETIA